MSNNDYFFLRGESVSDSEPYEYRGCGLEGVFLLNGYETHYHDGERHVIIKDIDGLHIAIGRHLVLHRKALSPKEIRFLRRTMKLSQAELAARLSKTSQSVARWEKGISDIPGPAEKLLRVMLLAHCLIHESDLETIRQLLVEGLTELDRTRN